MAVNEFIVLCDEQGNPTGEAPKLASHHSGTPLHRGFSCYVFNDKGELLVTQRALIKKVWPGVWTNSVCGHPEPGEQTEMAIIRRLDYELGMTVKKTKLLLPTYRYITPPYKGIIENEFCPVYIARAAEDPEPNEEEVEDWLWMPWKEFVVATIEDQEDVYSWWCKDQVKQLVDHPLVKQYSQPIV